MFGQFFFFQNSELNLKTALRLELAWEKWNICDKFSYFNYFHKAAFYTECAYCKGGREK